MNRSEIAKVFTDALAELNRTRIPIRYTVGAGDSTWAEIFNSIESEINGAAAEGVYFEISNAVFDAVVIHEPGHQNTLGPSAWVQLKLTGEEVIWFDAERLNEFTRLYCRPLSPQMDFDNGTVFVHALMMPVYPINAETLRVVLGNLCMVHTEIMEWMGKIHTERS